MDGEKLNLLLKEKENLTLEFKERYSSKIDEDIVAFANTKSGILILGVSDEGKILGQKLTNDLKAQINTIARNCSPSMEVRLSEINNLVIIEVPEGKEKPYSCSSGYYRRLDGNTQKMTHDEVRRMFSTHEQTAFESKINRNGTLQDVSEEKVKRFCQEANIVTAHQEISEVLSSVNVLAGNLLNNAGILMFAREVNRFIPQARMTLLRFKGETKVNILDRMEVQDDLLTQFEQAIFFLKKHLNLQSIILGTERKEAYDVPLEVWREAIANAIIHRDYSVTGADISVEVYDDRIMITNPGSLPKGLNKDEFGKISVRRNELLADLFFRMHKVEKAGTGIQRMKDKMIEVGLPEPEFSMESFFIVELKRPTSQVTPQKSPSKIPEKSQKIIDSITENPEITRKELAEKLEETEDTIQSRLRKLIKSHIIKRVGPDKGGHWEVRK